MNDGVYGRVLKMDTKRIHMSPQSSGAKDSLETKSGQLKTPPIPLAQAEKHPVTTGGYSERSHVETTRRGAYSYSIV
ncbi:hypothetical protein E4U54_003510 [Claviceps lovelessii]|nr:hypothetical protein E4U54_003510 [Claviceps lovelessii]